MNTRPILVGIDAFQVGADRGPVRNEMGVKKVRPRKRQRKPRHLRPHPDKGELAYPRHEINPGHGCGNKRRVRFSMTIASQAQRPAAAKCPTTSAGNLNFGMPNMTCLAGLDIWP
jgi:hypothetical protein